MRRSLLVLLILGCVIRAQGAELVFGSGLEDPCAEDVDRDRLADCVETGTGAFVSAASAGTSALSSDTDEDGISDGDEVLGTLLGLNLPAMGASPVHKNLFVEYDWMVDGFQDGCEAGSHRPSAAAIALVSDAFAAAPLSNPDGTTGITVIHDYGQGGLFSGGALIDDDGYVQGEITDSDYQAIVGANFDASRQGIFRYALMAHRFLANNGSDDYTGQGLIGGDQSLVALYCHGNDYNRATAIVHELGHNLGLRHGGGDDCGFKPNYDSVMNYRFHFYGSDADCNGVRPAAGTGPIRFSATERPPLNENALVDSAGVCGAPGIDWNGNGVFDISVRDVNPLADKQNDLCQGVFSVLTGFNDWVHVQLKPGDASYGPPIGYPETAVCEIAPPGATP